MAHEKSITIQTPRGKWVNVPTVFDGKTVSHREATRRYIEGRTNSLGGMQFDDVDSAVKAAKERSSKHRHK